MDWQKIAEIVIGTVIGAVASAITLGILGFFWGFITGQWKGTKEYIHTLARFIAENWRLVLGLLVLAVAARLSFSLTGLLWVGVSLLTLGVVASSVFIGAWLHRSIQSAQQDQSESIFYDADFCDWEQYDEDAVSQYGEHPRIGRCCLRKDSLADPQGAYKKLQGRIDSGFVFSGWLRRDELSDSNNNRLALEDVNYNGYGFSVSHSRQVMWIERRERGRVVSRYLTKPANCNVALGQWYRFEFVVREGGRFELCLYSESGSHLSPRIIGSDTMFRGFDRVAVRGGYPYYVDELEIRTLPQSQA
jgi:hypothetical protein